MKHFKIPILKDYIQPPRGYEYEYVLVRMLATTVPLLSCRAGRLATRKPASLSTPPGENVDENFLKARTRKNRRARIDKKESRYVAVGGIDCNIVLGKSSGARASEVTWFCDVHLMRAPHQLRQVMACDRVVHTMETYGTTHTSTSMSRKIDRPVTSYKVPSRSNWHSLLLYF